MSTCILTAYYSTQRRRDDAWAVYGNVTDEQRITDATYNNGYYVIWEGTGRIDHRIPSAPWRLVDVEVMDHQY